MAQLALKQLQRYAGTKLEAGEHVPQIVGAHVFYARDVVNMALHKRGKPLTCAAMKRDN